VTTAFSAGALVLCVTPLGASLNNCSHTLNSPFLSRSLALCAAQTARR